MCRLIIYVKSLILVTLVLLMSNSTGNSQHCPWDMASIIVVEIKADSADTKVIKDLKITLLDSLYSPFTIPVNDGLDTILFWQNPLKKLHSGISDNINPMNPKAIHFWFAENNYISVIGSNKKDEPLKLKIEDIDGESNGGHFRMTIVEILPRDIYPLCTNFSSWDRGEQFGFVEGFKPMFIRLSKDDFSQNDSIVTISQQKRKDSYDTLSLLNLSLSKEEINTYFDKVVNLKNSGRLNSVEFENMSYCGGVLTGYFQDEDLVLMLADIAVEFSRTEHVCAIKEGKPIKLVQHQRIFKNGEFDTIVFEEKILLILTDPPELIVDDIPLSGEDCIERLCRLNRCYNIRLEEINKSATDNSKCR